MTFPTIDNLRSVNWGKTSLWDVKFDDSPYPDWFPATDVEEQLANLQSYQFESYLSAYKIPESSAPRTLKITFTDDINHTLSDWLVEWINGDILSKGEHVKTLSEACKIVQVMKLDNKRMPLNDQIKTYQIYPDGEVVFQGNSQTEAVIKSINFVIAGES